MIGFVNLIHINMMARKHQKAVEDDEDSAPKFKGRKRYVVKPDISRLISMVGSPNPKQREKTIKELEKFTWCDFEDDQREWQAWYEENKDHARHEWAADALEDGGYEIRNLDLRDLIPQCIGALEDEDWLFRSAAFYLLQFSTAKPFHFPAKASAATREKHFLKWSDWWARKGEEFVRTVEAIE